MYKHSLDFVLLLKKREENAKYFNILRYLAKSRKTLCVCFEFSTNIAPQKLGMVEENLYQPQIRRDVTDRCRQTKQTADLRTATQGITSYCKGEFNHTCFVHLLTNVNFF